MMYLGIARWEVIGYDGAISRCERALLSVRRRGSPGGQHVMGASAPPIRALKPLSVTRRRLLFWSVLNLIAACVLGMTLLVASTRGSAQAEEATETTPLRVCIRDVKGLLPDLSLAIESVERGFAEAQAHPDWDTGGRFALPARVSTTCQDEPSIYGEGVQVRRSIHWVAIFGTITHEVEAPGPFDLMVFVLPDPEIDYFFWTDTGTRVTMRRYVAQEMVCSEHGTPPNVHAVCGETTQGLYLSAAEVLDSHTVAGGLLAAWRRSR